MPRAPYVIPYGNPNTMMMTRVEERRYIDHDPYAEQQRYGIEEPYMEEKPRYYREPYVEHRYNNDRGYLHEAPTYWEPRALSAPHDYVFAGQAN